MNRSMPISREFLFDPAEIVVEISAEERITLILELTLLLESMSKSLRLRCPRGGKIDLAIGLSQKTVAAEILSTSHAGFQLGKHPAEYIRAVFLRAYRDKMVEVNHVHIDGHCGARPIALTFLFSDTAS